MDGGDPSISGSPHEDDMEVGLPSAPRFDIDLEEECQSTELAHLEVVAESNRPVKDKTKGSDGVPEIDMEFESEERAYNFYNKYGGKVGFSIRRSWANKCKDGVVRRRLFCCSRQGHRSHDKRDVKNHRPETRTGCLAHMVIALQPNGRYRVCQFEPNHNHDVGKPSKSRMLRSQKASAAAQAAETDISDSTGWGLGRLICIQMSIRAAIELDVFNIIAEAGPGAQLSSSEMVTKMPTTNPNAATALDRILRMLGANCILSMSMRPCNEGEKKHERVYGLTSKSRSLVTTNGEGASVAPIVLASSEKAVIESLYLLKDAVLEQGCIPFNKAHGLSFLEYAAKEPGMKAVFDQALGTRSAIFFHEVLKVYKGFNDIRELVDVGGGTGSLLGMIVSRFPHIRGINFELPHVIADAPKFPGVEHVAGDMFEQVPIAQAILLKWILHDWDDARCTRLLKNCWEALPNGGKVIVVEFALPPVLGNNVESLNALTPDLFGMVLNPGGKERTIAEYTDLAKAAGFSEIKLCPISQGLLVMELYKKNGGPRPLLPRPTLLIPHFILNGAPTTLQ